MLLKFQNQKRDLLVLFFISLLFVMGSMNTVLADSLTNSADTTKAVFNSLESLQISCAADDGDMQRASDPELTEKIMNLASSNNPEQRISALSQLGVKAPIDAGVVQKILQKAILDKDSNVRAQAVYAIAQQECTDVLSVLEQALHDSELSVRMMAVDSLGTDERSIFLLEQAKDDEEEAIRELAAMKLESLPNTGKH
ncbi:MAG: HEAT repeat domain-containing protein [Nitrosomonas sp.]|nr:HEAT repeat domain-containing protein [Nitrosomonas sp.]MBP6075176.1 HEAT repeat domain-containing protein [Nitrosomonas sp.]